MKLLDIISSPWVIMPEKLREIRTIYEAHMRGEKIDVKGIEARVMTAYPLTNKLAGYTVDDTAFIPISGPITKGSTSVFSFLFGSMSTDMISATFESFIEDPTVKSIIFLVDSPGGTVPGVQELAGQIFEARGTKPIITIADGDIASGAYWIGAAADEVYITSNTNRVGSIGVAMIHYDVSKANEEYGESVTEIYAGKYKRMGSPNAPLSDEAKAYLQGQVDHVYEAFVGDIAKFRGVDVETVLSDMADGRIFLGSQAINAGLVDGVSTLQALIDKLATGDAARKYQVEGVMDMTTDELKKNHPEVFQAVFGEGVEAGAKSKDEQHKTALASATTEAATNAAAGERARIIGIQAHMIPGTEKLVADLIADGVTTPDQAAAKILDAHKEALAKRHKDFVEDPNVGKVASAADGGSDGGSGSGFMALVDAYMNEHKVTKGRAISAVAKENPKAHAAWLATLNPQKKEDGNV